MKKIILFVTVIAFTTAGAFAQKYDDIKGLLSLNQYAKAKEAFDKSSTNEKFYSKPEGYLLKAAIFATLAVDSSKAAQADSNTATANAAFLSYKQADPAMKLLEDPIYKNTPYNLYAAYYNSGIGDINSKNYDAAYSKFKSTVDYSDILISKKIMNKVMDTSAIYYAGLLAENTKHPDEALQYYNKIADAKIKGYAAPGSTESTSYESVYQGLVRYYATKNDNTNFEKYKALGKELYPQSEFFNYSMLDFASGSSTDFNERVASLEKFIASNPTDYKANLSLGEAIYDTLDSRKEGTVKPGNAAELETKMINALNTASKTSPNELQPYLLLGDHYMLKSQELRDAVTTAETNVTKKGAKASADDKQKLADAKGKYYQTYDLAKDNYEKAADLYSKVATLDATQKRSYRIISGNLAEYYSIRIEDAKSAADRDKYACYLGIEVVSLIQ